MARSNARSTTLGYWKATRESWLLAGLDPKPFAAVADALAPQESMRANVEQLKADAAQLQRRARTDFALGKRTADEVLDDYTRAAAMLELAASTVHMNNAITEQATQAVLAVGEALVTDHLAPACEAVVSAATELLDDVASIATDAEAVRAEAGARDAWSELWSHYTRFTELQQLANRLRSADVIASAPGTDTEHKWKHPELMPPPEPTAGPIRRFANIIAAGVEPAVLTAAEAVELEPEPATKR